MPTALDRDGRKVVVNDMDLVAPICLNCKSPGTAETLRVTAFVESIPPAGRAYWACATGCTPGPGGQRT